MTRPNIEKLLAQMNIGGFKNALEEELCKALEYTLKLETDKPDKPAESKNVVLYREYIQNSPDCEHSVMRLEITQGTITFTGKKPVQRQYATYSDWRITECD